MTDPWGTLDSAEPCLDECPLIDICLFSIRKMRSRQLNVLGYHMLLASLTVACDELGQILSGNPGR